MNETEESVCERSNSGFGEHTFHLYNDHVDHR